MKRSLGYAAAISLMACAAHAQDTYSFVFGGATFSSDLDADGIIGGAPQTVDTDLDTGFQLGIGVGKSLPRLSSDTIAVRGEVELSYSDADADEIFFSGNGPAAEINVGGDVQTTALFGNLYADFASSGAISPYVGAGVGIGRVSQDLIYGPGVRVSDSDTAFGAQLIAGVAWETSETLTWTADVRYRRFFDVESGRFAPTGASTGEISGDLDSVSLNIGARFSF
ncbi:MAG: outer membrane beta-barrel protein [Pseudomonadota bacterium]